MQVTVISHRWKRKEITMVEQRIALLYFSVIQVDIVDQSFLSHKESEGYVMKVTFFCDGMSCSLVV
jgi:hypothetical protein